MPRKPDATLEGRILNAARKLWIKGGDDALSMRAVARAAKSNTPAIYRRFRNRKQILRALLLSAQDDLYKVVQHCNSAEEIARAVFEFALSRPQEYQLVTAGLFARLNEPQPNFEFARKQLAQWFGGTPKDQTRLTVALFAVVHGTAMLLISKTVPTDAEVDLREVLPITLELLVRNRAIYWPRA
jgi:AcrR family transcriptional regulator